MPRTLVVLKQSGPVAARAFADQLEAAGGHASVVYESGAAVAYADDAVLAEPALAGSIDQVFRTEIDGTALAAIDAKTGGVAAAWNFARTLDEPLPPGEGAMSARAIGSPADFPDAGPRPVPLGPAPTMSPQDAYSNVPYGADYYDTSEFMAGSVAVGVWLLEDAGTTYTWTVAEKNQTYGGVQAGLDNWVRKGGAPAFLTFFIQQHSDVPVSGTPIENPMSMDETWVNEVLGNAGWTGANGFEKCFAYNNSIRTLFNTNWCYSIVIVDSNPSVNQGLFPGGGYAWAYYGGPWVFMARYCTWAYNYNRYYAVVPMHESGHIFMATDEYNSFAQNGGYMNILDNDGAQCIMDMNDSLFVCYATRGQIGQRDNNSNGIIDPLDPPPAASLTPVSPDPTSNPTPTWSGHAQVVRLANLNPLSNYSPPHDQTIARLNAVECRADGGAWTAATASDGAFDGYGEDFTWTPSAPLAEGGHLIEARARTTVGKWTTAYGADSVTIESVVGVGDRGVEGGLRLFAPQPNPARGIAMIRYALPSAGRVRLMVLGVDGRPVRVVLDGEMPAGPGQVRWDGRDGAGRAAPAGLYFARIESAMGMRAQKLVLVR